MQTEARPRRLLMPEDLRRPFRYATRRNPELRTRGGKIAVLAAAMGKPLKPHQQYIADVATELNPPGSRLVFRYQLVIVAEPRQVGKTTLIRPVAVERCLARPGTQTFMTAQLGKDASARWEDLVLDVQASPVLGSAATVRRGKGDQRCTFPTASFIAPFPPEVTALHGYSPPLIFVDEAWAFSAEQGADLMRAIRPAQITKTDRQLWIVSAAGTAESEWWNELVELGRASVNDPNSTIAYFEHSADPDADPYDPDTWEFHPGLDGLITIDDLEAEAKANPHADFLRGFLNLATKVRDKTVVDLEAWDALHAKQQTPPAPHATAYGYDVAIDSTWASVWGSWLDDDGTLHLHVERSEEGTDWLVPHLRELHTTGATICADDGGPSRAVTAALRREGVPVTTLNGTESSTAWAAFKEDVKHARLAHDGSALLRRALELAVEKHRGDALALSRRHSLAPIDPLVAALVAAEIARRNPSFIPIF